MKQALEAAAGGRADELASLLQSESSLFARNEESLTLLATESLSVSTLSVLLNCGWNINKPESSLEPPLMGLALRRKSDEVVHWFLKHGADPNVYASIWRVTPLSRAVQFASLATVQMLFEHGGDAGRGELVYFACHRQIEDKDTMPILRLLLEKRAPINESLFESYSTLCDITMSHGTPLWIACKKGNTEAVRLLLQHGADPRKKPLLANSSPIELAKRHGHWNIVEMLLEAERSVPRI